MPLDSAGCFAGLGDSLGVGVGVAAGFVGMGCGKLFQHSTTTFGFSPPASAA